MSTLLRADDAPVRSRTDYWQHVMSQAPLPLDGRPAHDAEFNCQVLLGKVGAVQIIEARIPSGECFRTRQLIRRSDPDLYSIEVLEQGAGTVVEQDGRQARLRPGDLTVVDSSRPVRYRHPATRHVGLLIPRALLPLRQDEVARLTGVRIAGDRGTAALISTLARQLPDLLDDPGMANAIRLSATVIDLVGLALAESLDNGPQVPHTTRQHALLVRIHTFIEQRLWDPELTPATIAAAHYISLRYLHKLFESRDMTVSMWIRHRRLERCRLDLLDPASENTPVRSIAARRGFTDLANFTRAFKTAYGIPPGEYRIRGISMAAPHGRAFDTVTNIVQDIH